MPTTAEIRRQAQQLERTMRAQGVFPQDYSFNAQVEEKTLNLRRALADAIAIRGGHKISVPHPSAKDFADTSLIDMARTVGALRSVEVAQWDDQKVMERGLGHSTPDFPLLMAETANKVLLDTLNRAPQSHNVWVGRGSVDSFKIHDRFIRSAGPKLSPIGESAEIRHATLQEQREQFQLKTYGVALSISRQLITNDDVGLFVQTAQAIAAAISRMEADLTYSVLTTNADMADGIPLFDAQHTNLMTGAALDVASLGVAMSSMRKQESNGEVLGLQPSFLIVPSALETVALQTLAQISWGAMQPLTLVVEPRLDKTSATGWYIAARQAEGASVDILTLNGAPVNITPKRFSQIDGIAMKIVSDRAVGASDFRGLVHNPGI